MFSPILSLEIILALATLQSVFAVELQHVLGVNDRPYPQRTDDQYNILRHLGGLGPYIGYNGWGIAAESEIESCTIDQAHLLMRHGERYPSTNVGKQLEALYQKLLDADVEVPTGPLSFFQDYDYFVSDAAWYEQETTKGFYSGLNTAFDFGTTLRERYDHLINTSEEGKKLSVWAGSQERVVDTAKYFAQGFMKSNYTDMVEVVALEEEKSQGLNSLTARISCPNYNSHIYKDGDFPNDIAEREADRLNTLSPGFNITADDIPTIALYCGFELNVRGESSFCDVLSREALLYTAYLRDLGWYYNVGNGNPLGKTIGYVYANATRQLLENTEADPRDYPLYFSFSHDTDLLQVFTSLGLFNVTDLPLDQIQFQTSFKSTEIVPMGARLLTERLLCTVEGEEKYYVRTILNDAVFPLSDCSSGPGFSCPLNDYVSRLEALNEDSDFAENCGVPKNASYPLELSFFWDDLS
ncbi:Repressible acid phosphatase [Komagataella phaffii CBS 7435]|uniref:Acid phosphatase PHO1 n=3 Tax=Komagataella TaxID=460517 RepID=PPA1_PICPA|nr:uncharacterized protein PAS_chr2-1_0103 [Komagataella phaffii GS115]P52291.1 RecName: Full=Acid phosphatase PHO1; Flags: Precursor [Komagataella pastoris]AOA63022.1 GQ67_00129T0 [Komagataella phaffii]CAH2448798.1 Repressible acid phosphatase [Komagataella phaffii CBS 7435]AAA85503.1 acid phosphatase [Komagataella pastoris]AOA67085.1 GQ68_01259T0 [Komagataella phaffii GS115]CAY68705.1 One of three repressible acid phosphatases, a glycoprotein that is transported to the cell surface [Komagat